MDRSPRTVSSPRKFPAASNAETPSFFMAFMATSLEVMRTNMAFMAVPASAPLVPLLARIPRAVERSVKSTPAVRAAPPHPINASISISAVVLALLLVCTARSKYPAISSTPRPRADILSVTRSLHRARSICVASDSRRTGSSPAMDRCVSQPARAMYPSASAASVAVLVVFAPISRAAASSALYCSSLAPAMADVLSMACSKSAYVEREVVATAAAAVAAAAKAVVATFPAALALFPNAERSFSASRQAFFMELSYLPAIFTASS